MKTVEYLELDEAAAEAFDRYTAARSKKSEHDAKCRQLDRSIKDDRDYLLQALGEHRLGRLPDGRLIAVEEKSQHRAAQKACTITWQTIILIEDVGEE